MRSYGQDMARAQHSRLQPKMVQALIFSLRSRRAGFIGLYPDGPIWKIPHWPPFLAWSRSQLVPLEPIPRLRYEGFILSSLHCDTLFHALPCHTGLVWSGLVCGPASNLPQCRAERLMTVLDAGVTPPAQTSLHESGAFPISRPSYL